MDVACAVHAHRLFNLALQIPKVRYRRGCDIRNAVRHGDERHVLALTPLIARFAPGNLRGGRSCRRRRCRRTLHAGIHIGLVVVADIEHIVITLKHARKAAEADIGRAAVAAHGNDPRRLRSFLFGPGPECGGHAGGDCGRIAEKRMEPGKLPARFRIGR